MISMLMPLLTPLGLIGVAVSMDHFQRRMSAPRGTAEVNSTAAPAERPLECPDQR